MKLALAAIMMSFSMGLIAQGKINGVSLVGHPSPIEKNDLAPINDINANWITLIPFSYGRSGESKLIFENINWQWWGETYHGVDSCITIAQELGLNVMIKPQIWFDHGTYTGFFELENEVQWRNFESKYTDYILKYAELSEERGLKVFCIGTELSKFAVSRPGYWNQLIERLREVYSGELTYASNWDTCFDIPFWENLDYIGVDAYFPLCDDKTPDTKKLCKGWEEHKEDLSKLSSEKNKPILFTEWGYRSSDYCAKQPWDYGSREPVNFDGQYNAYSAIFEMFWHEDWFSGGFLWKWYPIHSQAGGPRNDRFTPQNKPAQDLLKQWFSKL